jgi:spore coat polysaccharide biosynthesis protein SpsF (cytidylyltransferase family)
LTSNGERIVAVVQARTSSQRFPEKILADVGGSPLLARLLRRLRSSRECAALAVATSTTRDDDAVAAIADAEGVSVVRGPLNDVLERYRIAAETLDADALVRVTGDCPLVDAQVVDSVIRAFRAADVDYASNVRPPTFPDGLDVEVVSRDALERAAREAMRPSEREHVTLYIAEHPELFRSQNVTHAPDLSAMRWTVDYPDDLEFVRGVFRTFRGREETFRLEDVLAALASDDALARLMPADSRNEGLGQSLDAERARIHSEP